MSKLSDRPYRIQTWETARELSGFLSRCDAGSVFLGQELEEPARLYSITLYLDDPIRERFGIGVATRGPGVPHLLLKRELGLALIAADHDVRGIDVDSGAVSFHLASDSPFWQFIETADAGVILVFYRTGIIAIAEDGWELWRRDTGRILDWASEEGTLFLRLDGAPNLKLDVRTGAELV